MPVTQWGHVSYSDDPHARVFRIVYPTKDDSELDGPVTGNDGRPIKDPNGVPYTWANFGTDQLRTALHIKVPQGTAPKLHGTPSTPKTEPVIYWVNADTLLASLTAAQSAQLATWLAADQSWSNNFIDLGNGDVATLTANLVAPCWIVVIDGGTPTIGALQRTLTAAGHTAALWVA